MIYRNKFGISKKLEINIGDNVEIILKSYLNCRPNEEPIFHSGSVKEFIYDHSSAENPVGCYIKFNKDFLYDEGEEDFLAFYDIEDIFVKELDIIGFGEIHKGVTLNVKFPDDNIKLVRFEIHGKTHNFKHEHLPINDLIRYGIVQRIVHYLLTRSNKNEA